MPCQRTTISSSAPCAPVIPGPCGDGTARRSGGIRCDAAVDDENGVVGCDSRAAISSSRTAGWHRGHDRRGTSGTGQSGCDDRLPTISIRRWASAGGTGKERAVFLSRENIPPADYLGASYLESWTRALEVLLERHGLATRAEVDASVKQMKPAKPKRVLTEDLDAGVLAQ